MKKTVLSLMILIMSSLSFAGPDISSGPSATEELIEKLKTQAVMDVFSDSNVVVEKIEGYGTSYSARVRTVGGATDGSDMCEVWYFEVNKSDANGPLAFTAKYLSLYKLKSCNE